MNKEKQHIQQLIDRYMAAETTQAEEALLADYFCTHHDVPAEWRTFSILFRGLRQGKAQEAPRRKPTLLRWSAAAVVVVAMGAGLLFLPSDHSDVAPTQPVAVAVHQARQTVAPQSVAPQPERQGLPFASVEFENRIDSLMAALQERKDTALCDTTFYSNDREGHVWWDGINGRCPTHATVVRTSYSKKDHAALRQQLLDACQGNAHPITTDDEECQFLLLSWRDMALRLHGLLVYYYPDGQLVVVRADGLNAYQICISHYSADWFKAKRK